ncbi:AAA family ATPase [Methanoculleus sp. UBA303]|mgnify:FL=1|jgi:MoxR-like ATPase|uniref:AAA family ATPase n=1 Tax=Methanoculleus sp. UBA303 TaxID=1915497 RepID=UPI0025FED5AE|nr:MoxR family ATPase [Methanoculleus sp. UBA303]MDD3933851.1 MoxR family ATPase [Methanoculleus sp.]
MSDNLTERIETIANTYEDIRLIAQQVVVGNRTLIEEIFISMISGGHLLIEGVPGTAKTTICKIIARLIDYDFKRVQGAVDLQPADIIGVRIYDRSRNEFILQKGPIFTNFLMVDEINRLTPKTQGALLEAMSERQATIDGTTYPLGDPYFVIATQNPHEAEGTFPLIEAQCDRFMFSTVLEHLDPESELEVLRRERAGELDWKVYQNRITPVLSPAEVKVMAAAVREVRVDETILGYIRDIVLATRSHGDIRLGASSRASIALLRGSMARAALNNRDYVIPDDVRALALPALRHRVILSREAAITGVTPEAVITEIVESVGVS